MYFLKHYIEFSIKYKLLVGDSLNEDIKYYIWKIYKKEVAKDILKLFFRNTTLTCEDCLTTNWEMNPLSKSNFYQVSACSRGVYYFTDYVCCRKIICYCDCKFKINCDNCNNRIKYTMDHSVKDVGWNPIEELQEINIECNHCHHLNIKKLTWSNSIH